MERGGAVHVVPNYTEFGAMDVFSVGMACDLDANQLHYQMTVWYISKSRTARSKYFSREAGKQSVVTIQCWHHKMYTGLGIYPSENKTFAALWTQNREGEFAKVDPHPELYGTLVL